jgi:hypothetical protein
MRSASSTGSISGDSAPPGRAAQDLAQLLPVGVPDLELEEEAVELGLGQRVRALLLDRVLRRHHEERLGQVVRLPADGHAPLLHRLEHRRLRLGRRAVDLVGEHDLREHRPRLEHELARTPPPLLLAAPRSCPVMSAGMRSGVNWIRAKSRLSASESERISSVLPMPGHALEQRVPAREQARQHALDDLWLPDHGAPDLLAHGGLHL